MEKRTIGQILVELGRISEADVERALAHQRDNGGYFGEALLACGLVTENELDWGLASQFDLPYVFPEADAIDPDAAAVVTAEWALANLTLPIMMTDDSLTVIVESPLKTDAVEELRARAGGRSIDLALASASKIRELVRQVYARGTAADEEAGSPMELTEVVDEMLHVESQRMGVSVRGPRATVWWDDHGTVRRRPLAGDWQAELDRMIVPRPSRKTSGKLRATWDADLNRAGVLTPVSAQYLADEHGSEYLLSPRAVEDALDERFSPPAPGVLSEVRLLARLGSARFVVTTQPETLGHEILPHLPSLLLDPSWRSVYLNTADRATVENTFSVTLPQDPEEWGVELDALRPFHFDVVAVDLSGGTRHLAGRALDVASVAFLLWKSGEDTVPAHEAGVRWRIDITQSEGDQLDWSLTPIQG